MEGENSPTDGKPEKSIIPYFHTDGRSGVPDDFPAHLRIYGLDSITDFAEPIYIVEGEKCAAALHGLGLQAVTSLGGSKQADKANWSALRDAGHIYILPDNDEPGMHYAKAVYDEVRAFPLLHEIKLVQFPLYEKGDVCDFLASLDGMESWDGLSPIEGVSLGDVSLGTVSLGTVSLGTVSLGKESLRNDTLDDPSLETACLRNADALKGGYLRSTLRMEFERYRDINAAPIPNDWLFQTTRSQHQLITVNDFTHMELPKREMLLAPWMPEGSISMVFADRGIGKTFFCLSCAVALVNGETFINYDAPKPVPVLYLDGEMQATAMQKRLKLITRGMRTKAPLILFTPDCQNLTHHIPDIGTDQGRTEINEMIQTQDIKAVFIDNISSFVRTGNENEGDSWAPIQEWAVQLRKQGIAVVFIHHGNKEGKQRGSHKKEDVMDIVIQLKRPDDYIQGTDDTRIQISYTKSRHLEAGDVQDIEATLKTTEGVLEWGWVDGDNDFLKVVELLKSKVSYQEIGEDVGVSKSTVSRWKTKAVEMGLL
jgi:putative DNA primase/helicase